MITDSSMATGGYRTGIIDSAGGGTVFAVALPYRWQNTRIFAKLPVVTCEYP